MNGDLRRDPDGAWTQVPRVVRALIPGLFVLAFGGPLMGQEPGSRSWTSDRQSLQVGDVITVFVDEATLATANRVDLRGQDRSRDLGIDVAAEGVRTGGSARTRADLRDRTMGESSRRERFSTEVSARIVEVGPNGLVRVEGRKQVRIDNHEQVIAISGWLRSADLSGSNTVESWRLANADVRYESSGDMGRVRGIWARLLGWLWP